MPLLFVDLDDTIVDRTATLLRWAEAFADENGLGRDAVRLIVEEDGGGYRNRDDFAGALRGHFGPVAPVDGPSFMASFVDMFRCEPETLAAIGRVRDAGWHVAIVTNGGGPAQTRKIRAAGLEGLVDAVCISQIEGCAKPDPRLFAIAAERLRLPLDGWMIGDNADNDIGGAVAAGLSSVWLRRDRIWDVETHAPTFEADSFAEAVDLVFRVHESG